MYEYEGEVRFSILRTEIENTHPKRIATFYSVEKGNTGEVLYYETILRERSKIVERIRHPIENFHISCFEHCSKLSNWAVRTHPLRVMSLALDGRGDVEEVENAMKVLGIEGTVSKD